MLLETYENNGFYLIYIDQNRFTMVFFLKEPDPYTIRLNSFSKGVQVFTIQLKKHFKTNVPRRVKHLFF